ncbi:alpha/beta hydrolase [Spirulina subsalsa FACHB-351]|uniref:Alpha/beta hydrolase n=1 Tax=Spirulina subsalsa FACHB-351 TaxID=234711 RepID=A0ABT3L821_9CYAN|nr:alpha/beta hydrolase [Spirulina subsalsa]MCW6037666.1 alpha/beta hydrolase [Spirulina subsalsa FACHB-351]
MQLPVRNSRIRLSQGQMFWREVGKGTPLVFLHGAGSDGSQWLPVFERLGDHYQCFAPDLLGFGESEQLDIHQSIHLHVECLEEYIAALKLEKFYLVSYSIGAWVATHYTLKYPEKVQGMVVIAPEGVDVKEQEGRWKTEKSLTSPRSLFCWWLQFLFPIAKLLGIHSNIEQLLNYRKQLLACPATCQLLFQRRSQEIKEELLYNQLAGLKTPALVLQGGQDQAVRIAQSKVYAQLSPAARLRVMKHGGADLPQVWPDSIVQEIRRFAVILAEIRG